MAAVEPLPSPADVAAQLFPDQPRGFPFDGFDLEELILPDGDDFGIRSEDDEGGEEEIETETGFGSVIVVDNLPKIPDEKFDKLLAVIKKIYGQIGHVRDVQMPKDAETGLTKGFAFVEFSHPQEALAAREQTQGYRLDKTHTFAVCMFDDFDRYSRVPDTYTPPAPKPQDAAAPGGGLHSWLLDKLGRDQFAARYGDEAAVLWNDGKRGRAEEVYRRTFWTESFVQWSPQGNVLATVHRQGCAVWGGPQFARLARFAHPGVQLIDFSPNERYLLSYSPIEPRGPREPVGAMICIFDARSGRKLRAFEGAQEEFSGPQQPQQPPRGGRGHGGGHSDEPPVGLRWPVFKWAGGKTDSYFARLGKNAISVYTAPDMTLLDKKSLKMEGVVDFEWSPAEPLLAAYTAEQGDLPARIQLVRLPERQDVRQKNLFNVSDVRICWHPQGDYLAVQVDRHTKTKKSTYTGFELFSIRERDVPMEVVELPNKTDRVHAMAWEPKGHRLCVVHAPAEGSARNSVSFFSMRDEKGRPGARLLGTLPGKACNQVHWSPAGKHVVLAGLKGLNGQLEFFSADDFETMAAAEHFMATDVAWDPTGRYVATSVTSVHQADGGAHIWSFCGQPLYQFNKDRFFQFSWRPRPASLLPPEKEAEIARNLRAYGKRYEEEDEALLMQADADVLRERERLREEWASWAAARNDYRDAEKQHLVESYGAERAAEREFDMETVTVEQVLDVKEERYEVAKGGGGGE